MNCEAFHDLLHEYLDETLDAGVQDAAREHLRQCDVCRHAFLREQALAKFMGQSLNRATAGLTVRPEIRRNVFRALESKPAPSNTWWRAWQRFIFIPRRSAGAVAMFLGVLLLIFGIQLHRRTAKEGAPHTIAQAAHYACVINVPIQTQTHVFKRQNNTIEDAIAYGTSVAHGGFFEDSNTPSKPSSKPL